MKRRNILALFIFLFSAVICVGAILAYMFFVNYPDQARRTFGPPDPGLGYIQRAYLSSQLISQVDELTNPSEPLQTDKTFSIALGEPTTSVINRLYQEGLISNTSSLRNYIVYAGLDKSLQAGEFLIKAGMTPIQIAHALQDPTPTQATLRILPGWRLE
jgi:hypothetical protein